jgi:hypothetical protein
MIRHLFIILGMTSLVCIGCSTKVTEFQVDSSGHFRKVGTFTEDESFKRGVEHEIDAEIAGQHPWSGKKTWEEYWRWRYKDIRLDPGPPPWHSTEFKNSEDMVRYIEQRRVARGLPPYD